MADKTVTFYARKIRDHFMVKGVSSVEYVDFEPPDQVGFEGDIAARFGHKQAGNAVIRAAVLYLEKRDEIYVHREPEDNRSEQGSQGQPYPARVQCTVTLR